jgi:SOS response regulatory protein OraA/RecX
MIESIGSQKKEPEYVYKDKQTKRARKLNTVQSQENIKQRLNQKSVSHLVYQGVNNEDIKKIRQQLFAREGCVLQIRKNNIYEIRAKIKKIDTIKQTIKNTIQILKEKGLLKCVGNDESIFKSVFNVFVGGTPKVVFTVKK